MSRGHWVFIVASCVVVLALIVGVSVWTWSRTRTADLSDPAQASKRAQEIIDRAGSSEALSLSYSHDSLSITFIRPDRSSTTLTWRRFKIYESSEPDSSGATFDARHVDWDAMAAELSMPDVDKVLIDGQTGEVKAYRNAARGALSEIPLDPLLQ
ncbi:hypothetical protein [Enemella sp. A6]|uniref:hypothetical protein n=1 Tax=Enemella sp. A6 TaxID=3440152 RepID=UPI003EBBEFE4